jgi:hypothetical protein
VARVVPFIRTYRPLPVTFRVWTPALPAVTGEMVVQLLPLAEVWMVKAEANAASQLSTTWLIDWVLPRSTCNHCGSANVLDQRVPASPSTAADAGKAALSTDEAVAGLPCDSGVSAALAWEATETTVMPRAAASTALSATCPRRRRFCGGGESTEGDVMFLPVGRVAGRLGDRRTAGQGDDRAAHTRERSPAIVTSALRRVNIPATNIEGPTLIAPASQFMAVDIV